MKASVKDNNMKRIFIDEVDGQDGEKYLLQIFDRGVDMLATVKKTSDEEVNTNPQHEFFTQPNSPLDKFISSLKDEIKKISTNKD